MYKLWLFVLVLLGVATILLILPHNTVSYIAPVTEPILEELRPELVPVCACESMQGKDGVPTQFEEDGVTVLLGKINKLDTGMCQINQFYHLETAQKMGLDIFTEQGNIKYANFLYDTEGLTPWNWSRTCWGN